jgi:hypothetical protein
MFHGAKLIDIEDSIDEAVALLPEQRGAFALHPDRDREQYHEREQQNRQNNPKAIV